jgi:hypothetical protein
MKIYQVISYESDFSSDESWENDSCLLVITEDFNLAFETMKKRLSHFTLMPITRYNVTHNEYVMYTGHVNSFNDFEEYTTLNTLWIRVWENGDIIEETNFASENPKVHKYKKE